MKVSIIIPVYNVAKWLPECLDSVLNQGWIVGKDYEILCVNDGSTDNSLEVLRDYEKDGITIINKENGGVSSARNWGIDRAKGEYIWMVDSDDFIAPNVLPKIYQYATNEQIDQLFIGVVSTPEITPPYKQLLTIRTKISTNSVCLSLIRREYINRHNIRLNTSMKIGEDTLFQFHIGIHFPKTAELKDACYFYRQRSSSVMHTHNMQLHFENMKILLKEYIEVRDKYLSNPVVNMDLIEKRINRAVQVVVSDSLFCLPRQEQKKLLNQLTEKKLYPYPVFWNLLTFRYGYKIFLVNLFNLLLPHRWYYDIVSGIIRLKVKNSDTK